MERYLKQAIVDKEPYVASAALVSSSHLASHSMEIIKRWTTEVDIGAEVSLTFF
jgi:coatomer protein complex subunit gamma